MSAVPMPDVGALAPGPGATMQRLEFVESKRPLVFDEIDFTVRDRDFLVTTLAAPLEYAQRVEALVGHTTMGDLMPRRDERVERFLTTWAEDELGHARALAELMQQLGLEPVDLDSFTAPTHNRWIPILGRASQSLHDVVTTIWATSGAMNEHVAMAAYSRIDAILQERRETALHETLFRRLRAHESAHKSFYATYAGETWSRLRPWQRHLTRLAIRRTWAPVGATDPHDKPAFARTVLTLSPDTWQEELVDPLQTIAERILDLGDDRPMEAFVERAVIECFEALDHAA
jgi:hypothetical protein